MLVGDVREDKESWLVTFVPLVDVAVIWAGEQVLVVVAANACADEFRVSPGLRAVALDG